MNENEFQAWLVEKRKEMKRLNRVLAEEEEVSWYWQYKIRKNSSESLKEYTQRSCTPAFNQALDDLRPIINEVCSVYITATAYQRAAIRNSVDNLEYVLFAIYDHPSYVAQFISSEHDLEWLRIGLAAALIENYRRRMDAMSRWEDLLELYLKAEKIGIDPRPYFESLGTATETGNHPKGSLHLIGPYSSQSILRDFLDSDFFRHRKLRR
jgi:hypothetical protein